MYWYIQTMRFEVLNLTLLWPEVWRGSIQLLEAQQRRLKIITLRARKRVVSSTLSIFNYTIKADVIFNLY